MFLLVGRALVSTRHLAVIALTLFGISICEADYVADDAVVTGSGYSGGAATVFGFPFPYYVDSSTGWYGGGTSGGTCSGTITVRFKWRGDTATIPPAVIVEQTCVAQAFNQTTTPPASTGGADNGLSDVATVYNSTSGPYYTQQIISGGFSGGAVIKHYSIIPNPGPSLPDITVTPSASCFSTMAGSATVRYLVKIYPLDIDLSGGIGPNYDKKYLVGQKVGASVTSTPLTSSTWTWSASGGEPFKNFVPDNTAETGGKVDLVNPTDYTMSTFSPCFKVDSASLNISCNVHLDVASGDKPAAGLNATVTRSVKVELPAIDVLDKQKGEVLSTSGIGVGNGYTNAGYPGNNFGTALRIKITTPASYGSDGQWNWIQIVDVGRQRRLSGVMQTLTHTDGNTLGHDGPWPYDTTLPAYTVPSATPQYYPSGATAFMSDKPFEGYVANTDKYIIDEHFQTFAMYKPPGTGSADVPITLWKWFWKGTSEKSGSTWTLSGQDCDFDGLAQSLPIFPSWLRIIKTSNTYWH